MPLEAPAPADSHTQAPMGFAGLASLVSDVSADLAPVPEPPASPPAPKEAQGDEKPAPKVSGPVTIKQAGRTPSWMRALLLALGLAAIGLVYFGFSSDVPTRPSSTSSSAASSSPNASSTPSNEPSHETVPVAVPRYVPMELDSPPVKPNLVFLSDKTISVRELRWCLYQRERFAGIREALPRISSAVAMHLQEIASDYDLVCGHFKYYQRDMDSMTLEVESRRETLRAQGRAMAQGRRGALEEGLDAATADYQLDRALLQAVADVGRKGPRQCGEGRSGPLLVPASAIREAGVYDDWDVTQVFRAGARRMRKLLNGVYGDAERALLEYCRDDERKPLEHEQGKERIVPHDATKFARDVMARYEKLKATAVAPRPAKK